MNGRQHQRPILILDTDDGWVEQMTSTPRARCESQSMSHATLAQLRDLAQKHWRLVVMNLSGAAVDQTEPLQALLEWAEQGCSVPLLVLSEYPSSTEARDAMGLGATLYAVKPQTPSEFRRLAEETTRLYKKRPHIPTASNFERVRRDAYLQRLRPARTRLMPSQHRGQ